MALIYIRGIKPHLVVVCLAFKGFCIFFQAIESVSECIV